MYVVLFPIHKHRLKLVFTKLHLTNLLEKRRSWGYCTQTPGHPGSYTLTLFTGSTTAVTLISSCRGQRIRKES